MSAITGPRVESWRVDLIRPSGSHVATLDHTDASMDWDGDRVNPLGMTVASQPADVEPAGLWLRATHILNGVEHPLATCVVTDVARTLALGETWQIEATDPTYILSDLRKLRRNLVVARGSAVVATVRSLVLEYAPELLTVLADSDATIRTEMSWPAGTPILTVANDLLDTIAYTPLAPDTLGRLHSARWYPANGRQPVLTLGPDAGVDAPFIGEATLSESLHRPTEVIAVSSGGQGAAGIVGRWPDYVPDNPVTETIRGEYADTAAATLAARRHMAARQSEGRSTSIRGAWQPLMPGQVIGWDWPRHLIDGTRWEVLGIDWRMAEGEPVTYTLQEVAR